MADVMNRVGSTPAAVGNGTSTLFTGTGGHTYTFKAGGILIVNNGSVTRTVKLGIGGVTDAVLIMPAIAIQPGCAIAWPPEGGYVVMSGTETLQANADGTGTTVTLSCVDQS